MDFVIVSAADKNYYHLVKGLVDSLADNLFQANDQSNQMKETVFIVDLGLELCQRQTLKESVTVLDPPDLTEVYGFNPPPEKWGFIGRPLISHLALKHNDSLKNETVIIWMDADTWLQDSDAISHFLNATVDHDIVAVPEVGVHLAYNTVHQNMVSNWSFVNYSRYYSQEIAIAFANLPMLNNGVFAARVDSPFWNIWIAATQLAMITNKNEDQFGIDQTSFNYAVYQGDLNLCPLDFKHNWIVAYCTPWQRNGKLVEPKVPHEVIGIVHLLDQSKWNKMDLYDMESQAKNPAFFDYSARGLEKQPTRTSTENEKVCYRDGIVNLNSDYAKCYTK